MPVFDDEDEDDIFGDDDDVFADSKPAATLKPQRKSPTKSHKEKNGSPKRTV